MAELPELLAKLVASIRFEKSMRWDSDGIAFSRPLRWLVALFGEHIVPFSYAKAQSGRTSRGLRPLDSPPIEIPSAGDYLALMAQNGIVVDREQRRALIRQQLVEVAARTGGVVSDEPALLEEVTDLVEQPAAILGSFEERYLSLPSDVLTTVMKKHQRYFPVVRSVKVSGVEVSSVKAPSTNVTPDTRTPDTLLPYFITIANGTPREPDVVRAGNEGVIRARYADAAFFVEHDRRQSLEMCIRDSCWRPWRPWPPCWPNAARPSGRWRSMRCSTATSS